MTKAKQSQPTTVEVPGATREELARTVVTNKELLSGILEVRVQTDQDFEDASALLKEVRSQNKALEDKKQGVTRPLNDVLKEVRSWFKPAQDFLESCEAHLKREIGAYQLEVKRRNEEALRQIQQAAAAQNAAAIATSVNLLTDAPKVAGISVKEVWGWRLLDASQVPREFLSVDPAKVEAHIKAHPGGAPAPVAGLEFFAQAQVTARR